MANYCKDCGAQFGNNTDRTRCMCGGSFRDEPGEVRPNRLLSRLATHAWTRRLADHQVVETGSGKVKVTFEFDTTDE